MLIAENFLI